MPLYILKHERISFQKMRINRDVCQQIDIRLISSVFHPQFYNKKLILQTIRLSHRYGKPLRVFIPMLDTQKWHVERKEYQQLRSPTNDIRRINVRHIHHKHFQEIR